MPSNSEVVLACAGAGKTRRLLEEARSHPASRVLMLTFTRDNLEVIEGRQWDMNSSDIQHIDTMTWFTFLLRECVKPYQSYVTEILYIRAIDFDTNVNEDPRPKYASAVDIERRYFNANRDAYADRLSKLACVIDDRSGGLVIERLTACYDEIYVDEVQDLSGPDLDFLTKLLKSRIRVLCVGDPRQSTFQTTRSTTNKQYRRAKIALWFEKLKKDGLIDLTELNVNYRCKQEICDFADRLFPEMPATKSENADLAANTGVHLVRHSDLDSYREEMHPQELRYNKNSKWASDTAINIGLAKGATFDRVLIDPSETMLTYIEKGTALKDQTRSKLYVAITRARYSVGIMTSNATSRSGLQYWRPSLSSGDSSGEIDSRTLRRGVSFNAHLV